MQSLGLMLHDAASLMKREFERAARPHQLTLLQWRVLALLSHADGLTQTALAGHLDARPMTISDVVERLEAAGLVEREVDPADSRAKVVRLAPKARPLIDGMRDVATQVYAKALAGVDEADRDAMVRVLGRIASNLNERKVANVDAES